MSNDYVVGLLVEQRLTDLRREADQDRLAREVRVGQPRRRWWERLMLFTATPAAPIPVPSRRGTPRPAATVAAGDSPC